MSDTPGLAQNISYTGPGDYAVTRTTQIAGGPRTVDITTTSGNASVNLSDVIATNPFGGVPSSPGAAIGVSNLGGGTVSITSGSINATGSNQTYGIDAKSVSGAITVNSDSIGMSKSGGGLFSLGRAISAVSASGLVAITSGSIATDSPTSIYATGASVSITSRAISVGGSGYYSFDPAAAIFAQDSGGGTTITSTTIIGSSEGLSGILSGGSGKAVIASDTISLTGLYARGIVSYGVGDATITSKTLNISGYGGTGIYADARLGGSVSITSDTINASDFATGISIVGGSAPITVSSKTIAAQGDFSQGISADVSSGSLSITSGSISTNGYSGGGIAIFGFGSPVGSVRVVSDSVLTAGGQSNGIAVQTSGPVSINSNSLTTTGGGSTGLTAYSGSGALTITSGRLSTQGIASPGLVATTGNGDLTIVAGTTSTSGGADLYSGSTAINASARGNLSITADRIVTTGSQSAGIVAAGTSVAIRANSISTSGSNSGALYANGGTISIAVDTVSSTATAITVSATGSATLTAGSVSSSSGRVISLTARTSADVTVDRAITSATGPAVTITAGTTAGFTLGASGRVDAGTQIVLAGLGGATFVNNGAIGGDGNAPTISATAGPLSFVNNGVFTGLIGFTMGNDTVMNTGTYRLLYGQDFGGGTDAFTNAGVLAVLPGTTTAGTVTLSGLEQFTNRGLVDLRNGHAGDVLVLPGTFSGGTGSMLAVDLASGGNGAVTTDHLVISGAATGSTRVLVNQIGSGSLHAGTIFAAAGAGSSATAFMVDPAQADQGLLHYEVGFDAAAGTYSLAVTPGDAVFRMLKINEGAQQLWYRGADIWSSHVESLRNRSGGTRLWGQMFGEANSRDAQQLMSSFGLTRSVDLSYRQDDFGAQLGLDIVAPSEGHGWTAGVMAGYLNSRLTFRSAAGRTTYDTANIGVYAGFTGSRLFANILAKYDRLWIAMRDTEAGIADRTNGDSVGVQAELGARLNGTSISAEPVLSLAYVHTGIGNIRNIALDRMDGLRGQAGVRFSHSAPLTNGSTLTAYLHPSYVHEFKGDAGLSFATLRYANQSIGDYAEGRIGVGVATRNVSGFLEGFGNWGNAYRGGGGRVAIRIGW